MTLRQYLTLMTVSAVICWLAWFFILNIVDPEGVGFLEIFFFYASLFLAIVGTFSVLGFIVRKRIVKNDEIVFHHVKRTFRQSILLSLFAVVVLVMSHSRVLTWKNLILLLLLTVILESIIFTQRRHNNIDHRA